MDEYNKISNLNELMDWMNNHIKYGYIDINGNIHDNELQGLRELFVTRDAKSAVESGYGTCIEQAKIIDEKLKQFGYDTYTYCSFSGPLNGLITDHDARMHSFVLAVKDDKCVYFEHANTQRRGIHNFDSIDLALDYIKGFYKDNEYFVLHLTGYIPEGLNFDQLVDYVDKTEIIISNKKTK